MVDIEIVKLLTQRAGLPGNELSFLIVPLPACRQAGTPLIPLGRGTLPAKDWVKKAQEDFQGPQTFPTKRRKNPSRLQTGSVLSLRRRLTSIGDTESVIPSQTGFHRQYKSLNKTE